MTKTITFPSVIKGELLSIAGQSGYMQAIEILNRGDKEELIINNNDEAQAIANVARVKLLDAQLKYPYWYDSEENHDEVHEENFRKTKIGIFEKAVYYISRVFDIESKA